ncbi:MAG TPA: glycosyltransferase family 2 protein [Blastococcus sp.]|jgi:glycosyltransferase involved in cell wall biosynthesis|nr:glycosyltransferase family 2 protein [Blastococcus sp.]
MYRDHRVAAVVPAYNEEQLVGTVIRTMPDYVDHIVVVDDCSSDATSAAASAVGDPRVTVIRHEVNTGVGGAIITGHKQAGELGADIDVVMAGDGQMDPAFLPDLLDPLVDGGRGFAKANRFFSLHSFESMPRHRVFGNIVLSFLTKLASGYWHLFDPQNGYTAITQDTLRRLPLDRVASRYSFENDLLIHLNILRVPAIDVPIPAVYGNEVSSIKIRRVIPELLWLLFAGFWKRFFYKYVLWSFSPIALFLFSGLFLVLFGTAWGTWDVVHTIGPTTASAGSVLLSVAPLLVGIQMLLYALLLDIQESPDSPMTIDYRRMADLTAASQLRVGAADRTAAAGAPRSTSFAENVVDGKDRAPVEPVSRNGKREAS